MSALPPVSGCKRCLMLQYACYYHSRPPPGDYRPRDDRRQGDRPQQRPPPREDRFHYVDRRPDDRKLIPEQPIIPNINNTSDFPALGGK